MQPAYESGSVSALVGFAIKYGPGTDFSMHTGQDDPPGLVPAVVLTPKAVKLFMRDGADASNLRSPPSPAPNTSSQ